MKNNLNKTSEKLIKEFSDTFTGLAVNEIVDDHFSSLNKEYIVFGIRNDRFSQEEIAKNIITQINRAGKPIELLSCTGNKGKDKIQLGKDISFGLVSCVGDKLNKLLIDG